MKRKFSVIKKLKKQAGIYIISCTKTDKVYIGESFDISARISKHFSKLRSNVHHNIILQNIFNKYGEETLIVDVLEWIQEEDKVVLDSILKSKEKQYQQKYPNCINYDKNGYAWTVNSTEEQKLKNKQCLDNIRSKAIEAWQKPLIIYNIKTRQKTKVESLTEACKYVEEKHIYRNIRDHVYLPYKGTYVAFEEESFDPSLILQTTCNERASISGVYVLYDLKNNEQLCFPSKTQFSLYFSKSRNDKLYDKYCSFIDEQFRTAINIQSLEDFWNSDFVFYRTTRSIKTCNMKTYYNALKNFTNNVTFAKDISWDRHLVSNYIEQKPIEVRIKEIEETAGHLSNSLKIGNPLSENEAINYELSEQH